MMDVVSTQRLFGKDIWESVSCRERADKVGGALRVHSKPGQGTEIILKWMNEAEMVNND